MLSYLTLYLGKKKQTDQFKCIEVVWWQCLGSNTNAPAATGDASFLNAYSFLLAVTYTWVALDHSGETCRLRFIQIGYRLLVESLLSIRRFDRMQTALNTFAQCNPKQSPSLLGSFFQLCCLMGKPAQLICLATLLAVREFATPILGPVFGSSRYFFLKVAGWNRLQLEDLWIVRWCQCQEGSC